MTHKFSINPMPYALGAAFVTSLASSAIVSAASNPFAMTELPSGYQLAAATEGKCGGSVNAKSDAEAKCGANRAADMASKDGKCGANKASDKTGREGKCGEGKCGANKAAHKADHKAVKEGKCGGSK